MKTAGPEGGAKGGNLKELLLDKVTDVWRLLSETDFFLGQTGEHDQYEDQLRSLRAKLTSAGKTGKTKVIQEVRAELVDLRKLLRLSGYDLSLARYRLVFDGFRHDDSVREGFRRLVLFIAQDNFYWRTGEANHIELAEALEQQITKLGASQKKNIPILGKHYLWYLRTKNELILSGAATELKEDYQRLKAFGEAATLLFLGRLKNLV